MYDLDGKWNEMHQDLKEMQSKRNACKNITMKCPVM